MSSPLRRKRKSDTDPMEGRSDEPISETIPRIIGKFPSAMDEQYPPPPTPLNEGFLRADLLEMTDMPRYWTSVQHLGTGAFGEIHLVHSDRPDAQQTKMLHSEFVVKILKFPLNELVNVVREVEMHRICRDHQNVLFAGVTYCQPLKEGYRVQMCLEYAALGDVSLFATKKKEERHIGYVLKEVIYGLSYIHEKDIVHGDLSVRNVLVTHKGVIKLSDFGMADNFKNTTRPGRGLIKGTPGFIAPEIMDMKGYDNKADMWSLGTFALFLLTGGNPFKLGLIFDLQSYRNLLSQNFYPDLDRLMLSHNFKSFMSDLKHYDPDERCDAFEILSEPILHNCCTSKEFMELYSQMRISDGRTLPYAEQSEVLVVPVTRE
ncbi:hypothetical protein B9Z55_024513 [Caenorhabditis nigoni]|uniref:Protein kinase domain-containing protein n=1 Tax=Caenorhabditis nigoni TaxID=1611254 RepID=A0A2G5SV53_9PELO|nr:hypothetical protein B9Z55_024513 [Caenorhabditis nigoni]